MQDFEKLGAFYLGRLYDLEQRTPTGELLLYESRDLVTHAVCVGMTGSGKTGLCIALIEEAAIDGVPAIVIDPKGDLSNLLLAFPDLKPADFAPWINPGEAETRGVPPEEFAASQAALWQKGLADWGQDSARIRRLRDSAHFAIYTPRSTAGLPVSILKSFAAPAREIVADRELLRDRVAATANSLLGLVGIAADPIRSREHILLSTILDSAWRQGRDLDIPGIIHEIQAPPVARVGALDLEAFYPARERFELAMALNNVIASPGFEAWLEGEPLDIGRLLHTPEGKPRVSIFSIAHLDDNERMFFVSLLLNQTLAWMRSQPGTTSLRAILYMDEIFGYFPPVANPPSKMPLLTLLKQARAFGLGVVLATQNPVDLDYKGLANAGTWFIGRLQTERDKARVLDGLEGAAAGAGARFDRERMDRMLSSLGGRVFLMNNVHDDEPAVFQTRWTLSYLRGPLTRDQIKSLADPLRAAPADSAARVAPAIAAPQAAGTRPVLPPEVPQQFLPVRRQVAGAKLLYRPLVAAAAQAHFLDARAKVDLTREFRFLAPLSDGVVSVNWDEAAPLEIDLAELTTEPPLEAAFAEVPPPGAKAKNYSAWGREFIAWLQRTRTVELYRSKAARLVSEAGESERDFRIRLQQAGREKRDQAAEDLRRKYGARMAVLQERLRRAQAAIDREAEQARQARMDSAVSFGSTLLGAFLGRRSVLGRAATSARSAGRARREALDVGRAEETAAAIGEQLRELESRFEFELAEAQARLDPLAEELETLTVRLKKTGISLRLLALAWAPYWEAEGGASPAW